MRKRWSNYTSEIVVASVEYSKAREVLLAPGPCPVREMRHDLVHISFFVVYNGSTPQLLTARLHPFNIETYSTLSTLFPFFCRHASSNISLAADRAIMYGNTSAINLFIQYIEKYIGVPIVRGS